MSKEELAKLNSFLTGLRQNAISTRPFRHDNDALRAFYQSGKLQAAYKHLKQMLDEDPRKKALIYSNHIGAGVEPYAAALERFGIPYGVFHGGISTKQRQKALADYNAGRLRALLLGPAGAEGLSTKGTNLIQLLDPHWHESRTQQAQGRGLRFDSHDDLPEELKNVHVQRFISESEDPSWLGKMLGYRRERTGDEILERLSKEKERLNERFRTLLREMGTRPPKEAFFKKTGCARNEGLGILAAMDASMLPDLEELDDALDDLDNSRTDKSAELTAVIKQAAQKVAGVRFYKRFPVNKNMAINMSFGGPSLTIRKLIPGTSLTLGNRAPRVYVSTPIPGLAYQQYISPKKHKITAKKEFDDEPEHIDTRTTYEKIRDFLFGTPLKAEEEE